MSQVASRVRCAQTTRVAAYGNTGYAAHAVMVPAGIVGWHEMIGQSHKAVCGRHARLAGKSLDGVVRLEHWAEVPERVRCMRCWRIIAPRGPKPLQIPGRKRTW